MRHGKDHPWDSHGRDDTFAKIRTVDLSACAEPSIFLSDTGMGKEQLWTPEYIDIPEHAKKMLLADIESEKAAILSVPHAYADDKRQLYQCRISKDHQR